MSNSFYHKDLTNAQWNKIKWLFEESQNFGRRPLNPRKVFNGILWILKSGARWRDLSARYDNWNSLYHKFRKRCECGWFERLLKLVNRNAENSSIIEIDSTFCKVSQNACCGLKAQAIGASRGGKNTKIHVLINERMQLFKLSGKTVLADRAYSCDKMRSSLEKYGAKVCIPDKANFKVNRTFDAELYKRRNIVERFFSESRIILTLLLVMTNRLLIF